MSYMVGCHPLLACCDSLPVCVVWRANINQLATSDTMANYASQEVVKLQHLRGKGAACLILQTFSLFMTLLTDPQGLMPNRI